MGKKKQVEEEVEESAAPEGFAILVIASKVKKFVRTKGVRCSSDVMGPLTEHVKTIMTNAVELAESDNMKTVQAKHVTGAIKNLKQSNSNEGEA